MTIRVLLADDHTILRTALRALLARETDIEVVADAESGAEAVRLLSTHPEVEIVHVTAESQQGQTMSGLYPNLRSFVDQTMIAVDVERIGRDSEVTFISLPSGKAMDLVPSLLRQGSKVIDIAADFRLRDASLYPTWYKVTHTAPEYLTEAVYGLPEVNREKIKKARLVANPGCYPTAVQLGFLPLLENDLVDTQHLIADAKSGVSGAGRKAEVSTLFSEAADSMKAYGVAGHRHWPEIRQGLDAVKAKPVGLTFVPHLTPMIRGIHATLYARLAKPGVDLQAVFEKRYANEPFVDVMPTGSHPETRSVRASNVCRIAVHRPPNNSNGSGDKVVVLSVIDNLVKGAAGQAIQNMNIMFGLDESSGLDQAAVLP